MNAGFLTRKVGPLPVWAWAAIGVAGLLAGRWLRNRMTAGQSAASAGASMPATDTSTTPTGTTYPDMGGALSGGGGSVGGGTAPVDYGTAFGAGVQTASDLIGQGVNLATSLSAAGVSPGVSAPGTGSSGGYPPAPYSPPVPSQSALPHSTGVSVAKAAQPFGGVVSVKTGKQGVKITTYASGRVVEKAPGKPAYVAKKGRL